MPASDSFNDPAVTVIPPERLMPDAIATGVLLPTSKLVIAEVSLTTRPSPIPELRSALEQICSLCLEEEVLSAEA